MEQAVPTFYRADFLSLDPQAMGAHMQAINVDALNPQEQQIYAKMKDAWMAVHDPENAPSWMMDALHGYAEFAGMNLSEPEELNKLADMLMFHEKYRGEWQAYQQSRQATSEQATGEAKEPLQQPASASANPVEQEATKPHQNPSTTMPEAERQEVLLKQQELRERIRQEVLQGQSNVRRYYDRALAESGRDPNDAKVQQAYLDATVHHFIATPLEELSRKIMEMDGFTPEEIDKQQAMIAELDKKSMINDKKVDATLNKLTSVRKPLVAIGSFVLSAVAFFTVHRAWKEGTKVRDHRWIRRAVRWGTAIATLMISSALGRQFLIKPLAKPIEAAAENEEKNAAEFIGQLAEKQLEIRERQPQHQPAVSQQTQPTQEIPAESKSFVAEHGNSTKRTVEEIVANPQKRAPIKLPPVQTSQLEGVKQRQAMAEEAASAGPII